MNDISKKTFLWGIVALIFLRFVLVFLMMHNIPYTDMRLGGFRPNFGGSYWPDEVNYFNLARSFVDLKPTTNVANIGYPLFLAPIIYATGATDTVGITKAVFIIQAFLFFGLAIILVALITLEIFKKRNLSLLAATLFVTYPYLLFGILKLAHFSRAVPAFHYQMWINIAADYLAAILIYLGFYLFIKRFNTANLNLVAAMLVGALISGAALVRVANILYLPLIFLILLWIKKYRESLAFGLTAFLVYLPQWFYNFYFFGSPLTYGYQVPQIGFPSGTKVLGDWFSFNNVAVFFNHVGNNLPAAMVLMLAFFLILSLGFLKMFRQQKVLAITLGFWILLNIGFYIFFVAAQSQLRYFIPSIPALIILFFAGIRGLFNNFD